MTNCPCIKCLNGLCHYCGEKPAREDGVTAERPLINLTGWAPLCERHLDDYDEKYDRLIAAFDHDRWLAGETLTSLRES